METLDKIIFKVLSETVLGNSLAVQWLGFGTLIAWVQVPSLGQRTKILQAVQSGQKKKKKTKTELDKVYFFS